MHLALTSTTNSSRNFFLSKNGESLITDDEAELLVTLAGFTKNDVVVTYLESDSSFKIKASKGDRKFEETYDVCQSLDLTKATASMRRGELKIKIPPYSGFVDAKRSDRPIAIKIK